MYAEEYKRKLVSAEEAVKVVKSGDIVDYGFFCGKPVVCDQALAKRTELKDVQVYCAVTVPPVPEVAKVKGSFIYNDWQFSKVSRILQSLDYVITSPFCTMMPASFTVKELLLTARWP